MGAGVVRGAGAGAEKLGALDCRGRSLRAGGSIAREAARGASERVGAWNVRVVEGCDRSLTEGRERVFREGVVGWGLGVSILGAGG